MLDTLEVPCRPWLRYSAAAAIGLRAFMKRQSRSKGRQEPLLCDLYQVIICGNIPELALFGIALRSRGNVT
jgi:hypothetical protein